MEFELTDRCQEFRERLLVLKDEHISPAEEVYGEQLTSSGDPHSDPPIMEELKRRAREAGLWNLFHPHEMVDPPTPGLKNVEYAPLAEIMGRSHIASEAFNCSAPDTGNLEVLTVFGTPAPQDRLLRPALGGAI